MTQVHHMLRGSYVISEACQSVPSPTKLKPATDIVRGPVAKFVGLTLLLRVGTLWRCGDGLFFEVPPLASDALLTTLHPLLKNVLQTVEHF
jgi:hypothetical protein